MPKNKNKRLEKKHHRQLGSGKILLLMSGSVAFIAAIHAACKGNILKLAQNLAKIKMKINNNYNFEYKEIGLQPGEKLRETLKDKNEILKKISKEIFIVLNRNKNTNRFQFHFEKLKNNFLKARRNKLIKDLKNIVKFC